jgi:hypothetical protein
MSIVYSDLDKLLLERWTDVVGLIDAHKSLQDRIEEVINIVGDRVERWARPQGFETETVARDAEIHAWRPEWADKRRGPRVYFAIGGFCPSGFRKVDDPYPYLWLYTETLENFKVKEPEREAFAHAIRGTLGGQAREWEAHDVKDADAPLGRYLTGYDDVARARLVADPDALFTFCTEHLPMLFPLADVIEAELQKLGR